MSELDALRAENAGLRDDLAEANRLLQRELHATENNRDIIRQWMDRSDAALAVIEQVQAMHREKHGENERGAYVICGYDKTAWPCATRTILATSPPDALDAVKREAAVVALEEAVNEMRIATASKHWNDDCGWDIAAIDVQTGIDAITALATTTRNPRTPGEETT